MLNTNLDNLSTKLGDKADDSALNKHKTSSDHDSRYYTKTQVNELLNGKIQLIQDINDNYNSVKLYKDNASDTHYLLYTRKIMVSNGSTVITIPSGHRPVSKVMYQAICKHETSGIGTGQIEINTNGNVVLSSLSFNEKLLGTFVAIW